jgi:hypothetical protein
MKFLIYSFFHLPIASFPLDLNTFLSTLFFNIMNLYSRPTSCVGLHTVISPVHGNRHALWCRSLLIHRCSCSDTQSKTAEAASACFSHSTTTYVLCDMEGTLTVLFTVFRSKCCPCVYIMLVKSLGIN